MCWEPSKHPLPIPLVMGIAMTALIHCAIPMVDQTRLKSWFAPPRHIDQVGYSTAMLMIILQSPLPLELTYPIISILRTILHMSNRSPTPMSVGQQLTSIQSPSLLRFHSLEFLLQQMYKCQVAFFSPVARIQTGTTIAESDY